MEIQEILKNNPNIYLHNDLKTLDYEFPEGKLKDLISVFLCKVCDKQVIDESNIKQFMKLTDHDFGINIVCNCSQKWFFHNTLKIPEKLLKT